MRVKIIKVLVSKDTIYFNYGDDHTDVLRHIVTEHTDFEEVSGEDYNDLCSWINAVNAQTRKKHKDGLAGYLIIATDQDITVKRTIQEMMEAEKRKLAEEEERLKEARKKEKERKEAYKAKTVERLRKKLEKLQKQIDSESE